VVSGEIYNPNATANMIISSVVSGSISEATGGKFRNGAVSTAFSMTMNRSNFNKTPKNQSLIRSLGLAVDILGKMWNLPNTLIGLAYGGIGHIYGLMIGSNPSISLDNNAIQFENNPLMMSAMTLGNVIIYATDPKNYQPSSPGYSGLYSLGLAEMQHTYQGQILGLLYFPAHIISGLTGLIMNGKWHGKSVFLEVEPHSKRPTPW
jgi:hypothetical protein